MLFQNARIENAETCSDIRVDGTVFTAVGPHLDPLPGEETTDLG